VDDLRFGARARRRQLRRVRRQRILIWVSAASLGAIAFGLPGSNAAGALLGRLAGIHAVAAHRGIDTSEAASGLMRFQNHMDAARPSRSDPALHTTTPETGSISGVIDVAAREFGLSGSYLTSVATCESNLDPRAYNAGGYYGLFQFDAQTWSAYGYGSIYDPIAQARTAARLLAAGQSFRWPNCA
jgi:soluble lytic murein transglycosylase-like protein